MRVLILGNKIFANDMAWGFEQAGCEATVITADKVEQMETILMNTNGDLMLTLGAPLELKQDVMDYLGKNKPKTLKHFHWDTDGISSTYYLSKLGDGIEMDVIYASNPSIVFTMCPEMQKFIRQKGFLCEIMHYAYSPISHYPMSLNLKGEETINIIGNSYKSLYAYHPEHYRYASLKIILKPLLENGYDVNLYGDREYLPFLKELFSMDTFKVNYHGYLPYERTCTAYNNSYINLVTQNHRQTITKRTFEILGSGGFVLSSDSSEIRKLFTPGRDLVVSSSAKETLELVKYYKENKEEWLKIRKNAVESVKNHTYKQRAEYILQWYHKLENE